MTVENEEPGTLLHILAFALVVTNSNVGRWLSSSCPRLSLLLCRRTMRCKWGHNLGHLKLNVAPHLSLSPQEQMLTYERISCLPLKRWPQSCLGKSGKIRWLPWYHQMNSSVVWFEQDFENQDATFCYRGFAKRKKFSGSSWSSFLNRVWIPPNWSGSACKYNRKLLSLMEEMLEIRLRHYDTR